MKTLSRSLRIALMMGAFGALLTPTASAHGGGLNRCGCHHNRQTGACHCHRNRGCGCECQLRTCG